MITIPRSLMKRVVRTLSSYPCRCQQSKDWTPDAAGALERKVAQRCPRCQLLAELPTLEDA